MSYNVDNYRAQGGDVWHVSGEIRVESGGQITAAGTQASAIADPSGGATQDAEARAAINDILAALRGAGIIASS